MTQMINEISDQDAVARLSDLERTLDLEPPVQTLTQEHTALLAEATDRSERLLAVVAENRWPVRELHDLLRYLRSEVIRQAEDEERFLFPGRDAIGVPRLWRDHVRLRDGIAALARAASGETGCSPAQLASTTRDVLIQLRRHCRTEEELLEAGVADHVPATAVLAGRPHERAPLIDGPVIDGPVIDLDALPVDEMVETVVARLLRLRVGDRVELRGSSDPQAVWRRMDRLDPGGYGFVYLQDGPDRWALQVTCRPPTR